MVVENSYGQILSGFTTDNGTLIDHLYTDLIEEEIHASWPFRIILQRS